LFFPKGASDADIRIQAAISAKVRIEEAPASAGFQWRLGFDTRSKPAAQYAANGKSATLT
jgi:hypothetical protein